MAAAGPSNYHIGYGDGNQGFQNGINHGQIHITTTAPRPASPPPEPSLYVPFPRDAHFVERAELIRQINARLAAPARRAALVGLGGVGKSQLAIEYAYRYRELHPERWVLWLHASSTTRLEQSVRDVVTLLKIAGGVGADADVFQLLRSWLFNARNGRWLVILDNADDADFLVKKSEKGARLFDCIPICEHGALVVTSRNRNAARQLIEQQDIIDVSQMDANDAVVLLARKLGQEKTTPQFHELVTALECMPLAITQAAAFLQRRHTFTIERYLQDLRCLNADSKHSLLDSDYDDLRRDEDATNSIILAWQISFEYIQETRRSAADLLVQMSLCDRNSIPQFLIRSLMHSDDDREDAEFDENLDILLGFSFITKSRDSSSFEMHRLVQLATRRWSVSRGEINMQVDRFLVTFNESMPWVELESLGAAEAYYLHARSAMELKVYVSSSSLQWLGIMNKAAQYAYCKGSRILLRQATEMAELCWEVSMRELGEENRNTLSWLSRLALYCEESGDIRKSVDLNERCWETMKRVFGHEDTDTLGALANVAGAYYTVGDYQKAVEMEKQCWTVRRKNLGEEHYDTLISMGSLVLYYQQLGEYKIAADLGQRCWIAMTKQLGAEHPDTLAVMSNLAGALNELGDCEEAAKIEAQCWKARCVQLGGEHSHTLHSMSNLAWYIYRLGDCEKGIEMEEQCWKIKQAQLGETHPQTLGSMSNLAYYYHQRGESKKAIGLGERCWERYKEQFGEQHPFTLHSMRRLDYYRSRAAAKEIAPTGVSARSTEQQSRRRR